MAFTPRHIMKGFTRQKVKPFFFLDFKVVKRDKWLAMHNRSFLTYIMGEWVDCIHVYLLFVNAWIKSIHFFLLTISFFNLQCFTLNQDELY